jgi:cytidylate kinase
VALPNTIAIDGPAGSGKSTVSFAVAQRIGYLFADTGAFYRAVTLLALEQRIDFNNSDDLVRLAQRVHLDMTPDLADDNRQYTILANERDITPHIHAPEVDTHVSIVAALSGVRAALLDVQRTIAARGRVIMAGRDIGTVVLPNADLKIYIDANLEERAARRHQQRVTNGESADLTAVRDGIYQRDTLDSKRSTAPLSQAPDAIYLDTSTLSLEEAIETIHRIILEWVPKQ